jgi:two-component system chemotaxis response regulator CheB
MLEKEQGTAPPKTPILIVDDSLVFRRFLRDILEDCPDFSIVGEAQNGIEALDMVLRTNPEVILLDLEMPLMDGMTALQHLMIHRPTPTIMFSSLTEEGTARCFDTIKNGAVDFLSKDFIFQKNTLQTRKQILIDKVKNAARFLVKAREPVFSYTPAAAESADEEQRVVFCEECGHREVVAYKRSQPIRSILCSQCGDSIELSFSPQSQFRRNTFITVIGGGEGCFANLLELVPRLDPSMGGALIAVIHQRTEHVNSFTEYLDAISAMKVVRARDGISIEGGTCYIFSGQDYMRLKPYSAQLTLQKLQKTAVNGGPLDILLASVSTIFKKRAAGLILSGDRNDGDKGIAILINNGGIPVVLDGNECYCKSMGQNILDSCALSKTYNTEKIVQIVKKLHFGAKDGGIAG